MIQIHFLGDPIANYGDITEPHFLLASLSQLHSSGELQVILLEMFLIELILAEVDHSEGTLAPSLQSFIG